MFLVQRLLDSHRYLLARNNQRLMGLLADEDLRVVILIPCLPGGFRKSPTLIHTPLLIFPNSINDLWQIMTKNGMNPVPCWVPRDEGVRQSALTFKVRDTVFRIMAWERRIFSHFHATMCAIAVIYF